jgi:hypothetical protein
MEEEPEPHHFAFLEHWLDPGATSRWQGSATLVTFPSVLTSILEITSVSYSYVLHGQDPDPKNRTAEQISGIFGFLLYL